ncbi:MAG: hypothetical protein ACJ797_06275 [Ktedonobacteraceae bacterium]
MSSPSPFHQLLKLVWSRSRWPSRKKIVNDTLDGSSKAIDIERAANNEAGHAIVGRFQGEMDMLQAEALARGRYPVTL